MEKKFEILPHTADLKIRAYGNNLQTLFCNILKGMFSGYLQDRPGKNKKKIEREVYIKSYDLRTLLVDFLSECLYLSDVYGEAYFDLLVSEISDKHIKCVLKGVKIEKFDVAEIKAVTHHALKIEEKDGEWWAEVLFDL